MEVSGNCNPTPVENQFLLQLSGKELAGLTGPLSIKHFLRLRNPYFTCEIVAANGILNG
jgi:hypothetical protein